MSCTTNSYFRNRCYYFDEETGLYYLQSRYYDSEVGRFINADSYVSTGQGILGHNMFAYCENNSVGMVDPNGKDAIWLQYPERADGFGHTSLLFQDEYGTWFYFFWGAQSTKMSLELLLGTKSFHDLEPLGIGEINNAEDLINMLENAKYKEATIGPIEYLYMKGDFSEMYYYLMKLKGKKYSLLFCNCVQECIEALSLAKYEEHASEILTYLNRIKGDLSPNAI